jgi:hypothetical protein
MFFSNCSIISKIGSNFGGLNDSCISGWLLGAVPIMDIDACIFWTIDLKVFCNYSFSQSFATAPPFPNLLQSWSFGAPSPTATPVLGFGISFQ